MGTPAAGPPSPGKILARRAEIATMACDDFWRWANDGNADVDTSTPEAFAKLLNEYAQRWVDATK